MKGGPPSEKGGPTINLLLKRVVIYVRSPFKKDGLLFLRIDGKVERVDIRQSITL